MFHQAKAYILHQLKAGNEHGLHSPFVYELYTQAIRSRKHFYIFDELEKLRAYLLKDQRKVSVTDLGAGSKVMKSNERKISQIAKYSVGEWRESQLLFNIIDFLKPQVMLELGTSLGLNSMYQLAPNPKAEFHTFEGCPNIAQIAQENFQKVGLKPNVVVGNIDETLPKKMEELKKVDYIFFDANHRYEPTIRYFETCLPKAHEQSIFIFDDIHWSEGMEKAWQEIQAHPSVTLTIDLFEIGLVFFRKNQPKQHFQLKI